ncbi:MAG TPA: SPFH domain-containing protein [Candidatus Saccharimonadales bacterium]|nr:SPFH domain-containing protein [Candidatus Saccharimonadales bacterium]
MDYTIVIGAGILIVLLLVILYLTVRVVNEYARLVVFRFGRTNDRLVKGPGLVFLIPLVDRPVAVDLREQFIEVPSQTTITKDNAPINIDFLIYWRIVDPLSSVVKISNFAGALQGVATTTLRAVIGDILLDEVLSRRDQINEVLRAKLDEVTERWGGKVTTVEIREITPPRDVQEAMNRQLSAERTRRAVITESEGTRQATINVAEGDKQSNILRAEGDRQSAILRAEGFAQALSRIYGAASGVDQKTMALQYLEALKALGLSPATKFVIPLEFTRLIEPFMSYLQPGTDPTRPAGTSPTGSGDSATSDTTVGSVTGSTSDGSGGAGASGVMGSGARAGGASPGSPGSAASSGAVAVPPPTDPSSAPPSA